MKTAIIPFIQSDLEVILSESPRFRSVVAGILVTQGNLVQAAKTQMDMLRDYVLAHFNKESRIPAIKYVRQWAMDNGKSDLQSLAGAKDFVCNLIPYES
jgi:hypothetical protein